MRIRKRMWLAVLLLPLVAWGCHHDDDQNWWDAHNEDIEWMFWPISEWID